MKIRIKIRTPLGLLTTLTVYFLFSAMYVNIVVPTFNFGGMTYDPRKEMFFELALLIFTSFLLPNKIKVPSDLYNWLYFIALLIPSAVLSAQQGNDRLYLFLMFLSLWLLMLLRSVFSIVIPSVSYLGVSRRIAGIPRNYLHLPYYAVFAFVVLILIFLAVSVSGAFNLNFTKVYEFRFNISENMPLFLRYLMPLASSTLIGYLAALACYRKSILGLFIIFFIGVLFFGFSSHKSMLFNPLLAISVFYLLKLLRPHLYILCGGGMFAMITLLVPADAFPFLGSLFAHRVVFIPNQINFFYFDFFSNNSMMLWAQSKIGLGLVTSELPMDPMHYIGGLMTGNYNISANTGWVASAYMNARIIGIIAYAAIIGCIFALIDFWSTIYGKQLVGAAFIVPVTTLILSADLFIVLLTTGLFALLIIFQSVTLWIQMRQINMKNISTGSLHQCVK